MNAASLQVGDTIVDVPPSEYAQLTRREQRKLRVRKVKEIPFAPRGCPGRVHVRLEDSHWCIPAVAEVTRVQVATERKIPEGKAA